MQTYALKVFLMHSQISLGCSGKSYAYTFGSSILKTLASAPFPQSEPEVSLPPPWRHMISNTA